MQKKSILLLIACPAYLLSLAQLGAAVGNWVGINEDNRLPVVLQTIGDWIVKRVVKR
jgi:hypothetical protein